MARMRTISATIEHLKNLDPDTAVTEFWLRGLLASGAVPYHKAGKKFLVNLDALETYLANPPVTNIDDSIDYGFRKIRRQ